MVTGHSSLRMHCHCIDSEEESACRLCGTEPETFLHLLTDCSSLIDARRDVFGEDPWRLEDGWDLEKLMDFSFHQTVRPLFGRHQLDDPVQSQDQDDPMSSSSDSDGGAQNFSDSE